MTFKYLEINIINNKNEKQIQVQTIKATMMFGFARCDMEKQVYDLKQRAK